MSSNSIWEIISRYRIVPVITIDSVEHALPLADALLEGGLPIAEITFRTEAAAAVIKRLAKERPELALGAGTVLTLEKLEIAKDSGAAFGVAPGFNPKIVRRAKELDLPFVPGICTPTEIEACIEDGCRYLKLFPAGLAGGPALINAFGAVYGHRGVKFLPTGGVNSDNLDTYLQCESVAAVGGTWIASRQDIANGNWKAVVERCRKALAVVERIHA